MNVLGSFLHNLKRFSISSILNIIGLTVALAAFLIIIIQVDFEYSFDECHPNADRIYRVDMTDNKSGESWNIFSRPFTEELIHSSPHIEAGTLFNPYIGNYYFTVEGDNGETGYKEYFTTSHSDLTKMFKFQMVEGQENCLEAPENILIPQSMAKRMFGNKPALGKQIKLPGNIWSKGNSFRNLIVGGVYKDFPGNTQLNNCIYTAIGKDYAIQDWNSCNYFCYIMLDENTSPETITENFNKNFDYSKLSRDRDNLDWSIKLIPLKSIYFENTDVSNVLEKSGNPQTPVILISIAILILVIAIINYMNFNMALAPIRIKSINTHKVLGSTDNSLRLRLISEAILMSIISYILAVILVYILYKTEALPFIKANINPIDNIGCMLITLFVAFIAGIIAGLRPAFYMTSFTPALVLKGGFGLSPSGRKLRTALIGIQFFVSIVLIIIAVFIYVQNKYMQDYNLGFNTDQIAIVELSPKLAGASQKDYVARLKDNPYIADVAFSGQKFGASDFYRTWGGQYKDTIDAGFNSLSVSYNFISVLDIKIKEGRTFQESDMDRPSILFLINDSFAKRFNIKTGEYINITWMNSDKDNFGNGQILGITEDLNFMSLRNRMENLAFVLNEKWSSNSISYVKIKAGADIHSVIDHIKKTIADIEPAYPVKIEFYDSIFNDLYKHEKETEATISLFGLLTIIISIVGVFGLVMFECQYKQKEISIRKTLGSSELQILELFNKTYIKILAVCFIVAVPVSYYIVSKWLENFAYKTPIHWWVFLISGAVILLIITITVSWQSWRAANANPVDALKNE